MSENPRRGFGGAIALILSGIVLLMITLFDIDLDAVSAKVIALPQRDDIDLPIEERLIVELYSK